MNTRAFGATGWQVSEIGLGCWQIGDQTWGNVSEEEAMKILDAAVEGGIDFFDTADVYGEGRSERLIGRFLQESRAPVRVATKAGRLGLYPDKYTRDGLRGRIESSIANLATDALDLLQLHCIPTQVLRDGEVFVWLEEFQQAGLIRHFGASVETVEEGLLCLQQPSLVSLQVIFNIFRQKPLAELLPAAADRRVAFIVRLPLASGLLSGKIHAGTKFAETDHRSFNRDGEAFNVGETFAGLPFEKGVELAGEVKKILGEAESMALAAQRWILDHPAVTTVITGATRAEQVIENVRASALPELRPETHEQLSRFYAEHVRESIRGPY